jgi:hypothetical protein
VASNRTHERVEETSNHPDAPETAVPRKKYQARMPVESAMQSAFRLMTSEILRVASPTRRSRAPPKNR